MSGTSVQINPEVYHRPQLFIYNKILQKKRKLHINFSDPKLRYLHVLWKPDNESTTKTQTHHKCMSCLINTICVSAGTEHTTLGSQSAHDPLC